MKIDSMYKMDQAAADKKEKRAINNLYYENGPNGPLLVGTNGIIIALVPVEAEEGDVDGPVAKASIKGIRDGVVPSSEDGIASISLREGMQGTGKNRRPRPASGEPYPDWRIAFEHVCEDDHATVIINAKELYKLAQALGSDELELTVPTDGSAPIQVDTETEAMGLIMPIRRRFPVTEVNVLTRTIGVVNTRTPPPARRSPPPE